MLKEFRDFIARGNVMDMAVGIIMGAAFTAIVNSMVGDLIMPVIGVLTSGVDFADKFVALDGGVYANIAAAKEAGVAVITYGTFINAVINFLIVSFVVFLLVKNVNRIKEMAMRDAKKAGATAPADIQLLSEIRDLLAKGNGPASKPAAVKAVAVKAVAPKAKAKPKAKKKTKAKAKPAAKK